MNAVIKKHVGLKEYALSNPWFPFLVAGMLNNWIADTYVTSKLDDLSNREALAIGRSFAAALEDRMVAEAGVDLWIHQFPALVELSKSNKFFLSMATTIGKRKILKAPWGLGFKVGSGAVLSIANIATDIYTIYHFEREGMFFFANASIAVISLCMCINLIIVYAHRHKRGLRIMLQESLIVMSHLKPVFSAFRVFTGEKGHALDLLDPILDLTLSKVVEM